jgi:hypothetical protein
MLFYFLNGYLIVDVDIVIVVVVGHFLQQIKKTIQQKIEIILKERKNFKIILKERKNFKIILKERKNFKRILKERLIFGYCNQK